uniref:Uncharacterized protein n=1 Tax=Arundo donax TaxID=35708 RepID=A0A0A8YK18_ARUDO
MGNSCGAVAQLRVADGEVWQADAPSSRRSSSCELPTGRWRADAPPSRRSSSMCGPFRARGRRRRAPCTKTEIQLRLAMAGHQTWAVHMRRGGGRRGGAATCGGGHVH